MTKFVHEIATAIIIAALIASVGWVKTIESRLAVVENNSIRYERVFERFMDEQVNINSHLKTMVARLDERTDSRERRN